MHKRFVNHCTIDLTISPCGSVLIKSSKEGADPTKPDMEFVETYHAGGRSIFLPGSSLKGAIRAHAERIVRTVSDTNERPSNSDKLWASDPLSKDKKNNPNFYLEDWKSNNKSNPYPGATLYKESCFTSQMFGSTSVASRIRVEDAYPLDVKQLKVEERNGVAIDRVFGSAVPGALFNYQVCTSGEFHTKIHLKNFTLAQLGLIGLVLRDLNDGWFGLGFAKSRGMGLVETKLNSAIVQYPGCVLDGDSIKAIGTGQQWRKTVLLGVGEFLDETEAGRYGFPKPDQQDTPVAGAEMPLGFGVQLTWSGAEQVKDLFMRSVKSWSQVLGVAA
ncbi:MAG: RAMP superfamily CRISPR-associated protein [Elainellaceae cyanobacterium]